MIATLFGFNYRARLKRNPFHLTYSDCYNNIKQNDMGKDSRYSATAGKYNKFEVSLDFSFIHLSKCACKILNYFTAETYAYPYNTKIHRRNIQLNIRLSRSLISLSYNARQAALPLRQLQKVGQSIRNSSGHCRHPVTLVITITFSSLNMHEFSNIFNKSMYYLC
jgi:hypothetical protein